MDFDEILETVFIEAYKSGRIDGQDGIFIKPEIVFKNFFQNLNDKTAEHESLTSKKLTFEKIIG